MEGVPKSNCAWKAPEDVKETIKDATRIVMRGAITTDESPSNQKIFWAIRAWRSARDGSRQAFKRALKAYPDLKHQFNVSDCTCFDVGAFFAWLAGMVEAEVESQIKVLETDEQDDSNKQKKRLRQNMYNH